MGTLRRVLLTALPKFLLSRSTGLVTRIPLPRFARGALLGRFARSYKVDTSQMVGTLQDYRSLFDFFRRPLRDGARPIDPTSEIVWPCDGKIVTAGAIVDGRIPQVKGRDYGVDQLLQDAQLAARLQTGTQMTVYLAPRDYHRVHAPFAAEVLRVTHIPGKLFPVNPGAVASIPDLFPRNEREVFACRLANGAPAAVVMVSALNVGDTLVTVREGSVAKGDELGQFGFGSTAIVLIGAEGPRIPELPPETVGQMGEAV